MKNEIISGYYFEDQTFYKMDENCLNQIRENLSDNTHMKKRIRQKGIGINY